MREALEEARAYRDPVNEDKGFSSQQIKMAYGVLNDPRYKQGNYSGAVRAIEKIARGLSNHPDVANALKRANEELEEASKYLRYSDLLVQKGRMQRAGDKQGERLTDIEIEKEKKKLNIKDEKEEELEEAFTKADFDKLEADNQHGEAAKKLVDQFGTPEEKKEIDAINKRHKQTGYIKGPDYQRRYQITNKYYSRLR